MLPHMILLTNGLKKNSDHTCIMRLMIMTQIKKDVDILMKPASTSKYDHCHIYSESLKNIHFFKIQIDMETAIFFL